MTRLLLLLLALAAPVARAGDTAVPKGAVLASAGGKPHFYLIAVGIDRYTDEFWPALRWPAQDARSVGAAFGVASPFVRDGTVITGAEATRAALLKAMQKVEAAAQPEDVVVFYLSGHGTLGRGGDGDIARYIVAADTRHDQVATTGLSVDSLRRWMNRLRAKRRAAILATCHSGLGKSRLPPDVQELVAGQKGTVAPLAEVSEGSLMLAAAAQSETAREDDKLRGDVYTHFLLEGLLHNDRNQDGVVSALEAHDYATERTYAYTHGHQRPTVEAQLIGDADVPLRGTLTGRGLPVLEGYGEAYAGLSLKVGGADKGRLPLAFPLADGTTRVALYAPGAAKPLAVYSVRAHEGEHVELDDVVAGPRWALAFGGEELAPASAAYRRALGKKGLTGVGAQASMTVAQPFGLALWGSERLAADAALRPGISVRMAEQHLLLGPTVRHAWLNGVEASFGLGLGRSWASCTFRGGDASGDLKAASQSTAYGAFALASYDLWRRLRAFGQLSYTSATHSFGDFGTLATGGTALTAGFSFAFGGVGERL